MRTLLLSLPSATALLLLVSGCPFAPELPGGAQLSCSSQADCPANTECRLTINRCVAIGANAEPPGLVDPLTATPALARTGVDVLSQFTVDKALGAVPKLALIFGDGSTEVLDVTERGDLAFEASFTVPEDAGEGLVSALLELIDQNGNPARIERPGLFRIDVTPPAVVLAQPDAVAYSLGAQPVLRVDLSEPVDATATSLTVVQIEDDGSEVARDDLFAEPVVASQGTALIYVAAAPLEPADHGRYRLSLTTADVAGNTLSAQTLSCGTTSAETCFAVDAIVPTASVVAHRGGALPADAGSDRIGVAAPFNDLVMEVTLGADSDDEVLSYSVAVGGEDASASCVATTDARVFSCTRTLAAGEPDGSRTISVRVADAAGNPGGAEATVFVDATGPRPLGNAQLARDDGNLRAQVGASRVLLNQVNFLDEDAPPPSVTLTLYLDEAYGLPTAAVVAVFADGSENAFVVDTTANATAGLVRASYEQRLDEPDEEVSIRVRATDLLGNTREADVATLVFDKTPPAFPTDYFVAGVVHERRPWGDTVNPASEYRLVFAEAVEPDATLLAWSESDLDVAQRLGDRDADGAGALTDLVLIDVDLPEVWVTLRDRAGNASAAASRVTRQRWHGVLRPAGTLPANPHEAWSTTRVAANAIEPVRPYRRVLDDAERAQLSTGSLAPGDGLVVQAAPADDWVSPYSQPTSPTYGMNSGWYDAVTGAPRWLSGRDVWELQGGRMLRVVEDDPQGDGRPSQRDWSAVGRAKAVPPQVLLFGGQQDVGSQTVQCDSGLTPFFESCFLNDAWRFDGSSWERVVASTTWTAGNAPAPRSSAAVGFDPVRDLWVLFGGIAPGGAAAEDCRSLRTAEVVDLSNPNGAYYCNDLWELDADDGTWTRATFVEGAWPLERDGHAIEWDPVAQKLFLFGGYRRSTGTPCQADEEDNGQACSASDLWSWNGTAFSAVAPGFSAAVGGLVWVETLGGLVTMSSDRNGTSWHRWSGAQWDDLTLTGDASNDEQAFVDMPDGTARSQAGGRSTATIYAYDGTAVSVAYEPDEGGGDSVGLLATASTARPQTLSLVGDFFTSQTTVGLWNGDRVDLSAQEAIYRGGPELVFDPPSGEFLYFGGRDSSPFFIQLFTSMTVSAERATTIVSNGYFSTSRSAVWYEPSFGAPVAVGLRHTSSNDSAGTQGIHIFEWDNPIAPGGSGAWVECASSTLAPAAFCGGPLVGRVDVGVAHDVDAGFTVVYGGQRADGSCGGAAELGGGAWPWYCGDTWLWDGAAWSAVTIVDDEADGEPNGLATALVFDPARGVLLFGAPRSEADPTDVFAFDGDSWARLSFNDGLRDSTPELSSSPTAVWDSVREATLLVKGTNNALGVWVLESAHESRRPALEARFDASATGVPDLGAALRTLTVNAVAGGAGAPGGTPTDGVVVDVYNPSSGLWLTAASDATASPTAPVAVTGSGVGAASSFLGGDGAVHVRVQPAWGTGPGPAAGEVSASLIGITLEIDLSSAP